MALNIFPRKPAQTATAEQDEPAPAPAIETADEDNNDSSTTSRRRTATRARRTTARSRSTRSGDETTAADQAEPSAKAAGDSSDDGEDKAPSRRRTTRSRARKADAEKAEAETDTAKDPRDEDDSGKSPAASRRRSTPRTTAKAEPTTDVDLSGLVKAIEQQGKQIEALTRAVQDGQGRGSAANPTYVPPARVGVFVDVANIELGADRARMRLDWGKVLRLLSRDRQLIRAIAYAPVHDDPQVSRETQRFVEPFLDKGYKIITKPLKRFSDGTIKANVDIELALDVVNMFDRLDVICLVSGDGDFEPLVKAAQDRGIRVEVVAMANSCSNHLRAASDSFIDLQSRANEVRS